MYYQDRPCSQKSCHCNLDVILSQVVITRSDCMTISLIPYLYDCRPASKPRAMTLRAACSSTSRGPPCGASLHPSPTAMPSIRALNPCSHPLKAPSSRSSCSTTSSYSSSSSSSSSRSSSMASSLSSTRPILTPRSSSTGPKLAPRNSSSSMAWNLIRSRLQGLGTGLWRATGEARVQSPCLQAPSTASTWAEPPNTLHCSFSCARHCERYCSQRHGQYSLWPLPVLSSIPPRPELGWQYSFASRCSPVFL